MAVDIKKLIAAISPEIYCDKSRDERGIPLYETVKKLVKSEGYIKAAEKAKLVDSPYIDIAHTFFTRGAVSLEGLKAPVERHRLIYDVSMQQLEPIYFWILDYINQEYTNSEKLIDNFVSSVGSGHFAEMGRRTTQLQDEAMKIFAAVNNVLRSVLNIIYDLKEFKIRLDQYTDYHSKDQKKSQAALYSLKQIWMDNVDIKRGNSSIKGLAGQFDYVTIIDAFMAANTLDDAQRLDLNDRVKRILMQRVSEFERWLRESERELRKRFEIEKIYLKSQINALRIYARWVKPYLKSIRQLEQNAGENAGLVNVFNTTLFELALLGRMNFTLDPDLYIGATPKFIRWAKIRPYYPMILVEFSYRSVPDRTDQRGGYAFRGRAELTFTSFSFNDDELKILREKIAEDDFGDVYALIEGASEKSLGELRDDLKDLLGEDFLRGEEKNEKEAIEKESSNPFSALFSFFKKEEEVKKVDLVKGIQPDSDYEKMVRSQCCLWARSECRKMYDTFKKSNDMPAFPPVIY